MCVVLHGLIKDIECGVTAKGRRLHLSALLQFHWVSMGGSTGPVRGM